MVEVLLDHFSWDDILKEFFGSADSVASSSNGPVEGELHEDELKHRLP
jgi:hypothetical protein